MSEHVYTQEASQQYSSMSAAATGKCSCGKTFTSRSHSKRAAEEANLSKARSHAKRSDTPPRAFGSR